MEMAREEEVKATVGEEKLVQWKNKEINGKEVLLTVSYNMGWNKRSLGNKYDSVSGHGFILGGITKKVLNHKCISKQCSKCCIAKKKNTPPPEHECPRNHEGSSKSMEVEAIYRMTIESFRHHNYHLHTIIADDDTTMKSNLRHSYQDLIEARKMLLEDWPRTRSGAKKSDNGRLPLDVPVPRFLADFNHRVKTVGKSVYALATLPKKDSTVSKPLAERIKTYWGTMLKQIRYLKFEEERETIMKRVSAPIEHIFNNHLNCDEKWCYVLKAQKEGKQYIPEKNRPMYDKVKEEKMYNQLKSAVERFQDATAVQECLHKYDTQLNESLNMSVARAVPKFKHFGTTMTLDTRIRNVIGVHNTGYKQYYSALLSNLGCVDALDDENRVIIQGIARINEAKQNNRKMKQTQDFKRRRKHGQQAKTKQQIYEEGTDRARNLGTYESGIAMNEQTQQSSTTRRRTITTNSACTKCGRTDHKTWRSKKCLMHNQYIETKNNNDRNNTIDHINTNLNDNEVADEVSINEQEEEVTPVVAARSFRQVTDAEAMPIAIMAKAEKNNGPVPLCGFVAENIFEKKN